MQTKTSSKKPFFEVDADGIITARGTTKKEFCIVFNLTTTKMLNARMQEVDIPLTRFRWLTAQVVAEYIKNYGLPEVKIKL